MDADEHHADNIVHFDPNDPKNRTFSFAYTGGYICQI
jgi:hypothetical protein